MWSGAGPAPHKKAFGVFRLAVAPGIATFSDVVLTCQSGFETFLARELREIHGVQPIDKGSGWVRCGGPRAGSGLPESGMAFPHLVLRDDVEIRGDSVNRLAGAVVACFLDRLGDERVEAEWPCVWIGDSAVSGLARRVAAVHVAFDEQLRRKLGRIARLARPEMPRGAGNARGLFVFFAGFDRAFVGRDALLNGQRRMADDPAAPSRSYLKLEEAFVILGRAPAAGESVCDLGAAPGGWSYSAAKRGARVIAVDNGPLKAGARDHPAIEHRREDAFGFTPPPGGRFEWLLCDLVEEPHHVLRNIVAPWLAHDWCRRFVVNLKFGRVDPIGLLRELCASDSPLSRNAARFQVRHLFHDREEFTIVGEAR